MLTLFNNPMTYPHMASLEKIKQVTVWTIADYRGRPWSQEMCSQSETHWKYTQGRTNSSALNF